MTGSGGAWQEARPFPAAGSAALTPGRRAGKRDAREDPHAEAPRANTSCCGRLRDPRDPGASCTATGTPRAGSGFPGNVLQPREHAGKALTRQ